MRLVAVAIAAVQGLIVVGVLSLTEAIVRAFRPEWSLPFSEWWGLLLCVPGIVLAVHIHRNFR